MSSADVGAAVRRWRKRRELTLEALSARTSLDVNRLSLFERGLRKPHKSTIERLENGLGWPPGFFQELAAAGDDPAVLDEMIAGVCEAKPRVRVTAGLRQPNVAEGYAEGMLGMLEKFIAQLPEPDHPTFGYAVAAALEQCGKAQVLACKSWWMAAVGDRDSAGRLLAMLADLESKRVGLLKQVPTAVGSRFEQACARSGFSDALIVGLTGVTLDELWDIRCGGCSTRRG